MNIKLRKIEVDDATAAALESRAAAAGVSVSELIAQWVSLAGASTKAPPEEIDELDRQWAAIKAGEPTVAHDDVVRWLDTNAFSHSTCPKNYPSKLDKDEPAFC